jgi:hypothetical protein
MLRTAATWIHFAFSRPVAVRIFSNIHLPSTSRPHKRSLSLRLQHTLVATMGETCRSSKKLTVKYIRYVKTPYCLVDIVPQDATTETESLCDAADHCLAWRHAAVGWQPFLPREKDEENRLLREVSKYLPDCTSSLPPWKWSSRSHSKNLFLFSQKMEPADNSETSVNIYQTHARARSSSVLKTEATGSSEMLVNTHHSTGRHVPDIVTGLKMEAVDSPKHW